MKPLDTIPNVSFQVTFRSQEDLYIPPKLGLPWRKALGAALKEVCCPGKTLSCEACREKIDCLFFLLYQQHDAPGQRTPPRPMVMHLDWSPIARYCPKDTCLGFSLTLLGEPAIQNLALLEEAVNLMGQRGLGRERHRLTYLQPLDFFPTLPLSYCPGVARNSSPSLQEVYGPMQSSLVIHFLTPSIIVRRQRHLDHGPSFVHLLESLLERLFLLWSLVHKPEGLDQKMLDREKDHYLSEAKQVTSRRTWTYWQSYQEFSARKQEPESLSGFMGSVCYDYVPQSLISLLLQGVITHLGKSVSRGLGAYALQIGNQVWQPPFWEPPDDI